MMSLLWAECAVRSRILHAFTLAVILITTSIALSTEYQAFLAPAAGIAEEAVFRILHILITLFGFPLVLALSHPSVEGELQAGHWQLYLTHLSYAEVVAGKFLGILLFWSTIITLSYGTLALFYTGAAWWELGNMYAMVTFAAGATVLLSSCLTNPTSILLAGLLLWLLILSFSLLSWLDEWPSSLTAWVAPTLWSHQPSPWSHAIPILLGIACSALTIPMLRKRGV